MSIEAKQVVRCSYQEVLAQLEGLSAIDLATTPYSKHFIAEGILYFQELKKRYEAGEVRFEDEYLSSGLNEAHLAQSNEILEEKAPQRKRAVLPREFKQVDPISISKMDWEALQQVIPLGSITPATPGAFYAAQELKLPIHNGFVRNTTHFVSNLPARQLIAIPGAVPHRQNDNAAVNIEFQQKNTKLIPVSVGCAIKSIGNEPTTVLAPQATDPIVWQRKDYIEKIAYTISAANAAEFTTIDLESFYPSKAEQAYFSNKMPLPADLQAEILRSPDDTLSLIAAYLGMKSATGGTNFRYVCNPYLSDFLQANKDDLALIVHELKVGHCDLLAWYAAAQLRAFGRPAWVASGLVTIPDGSAFNAAFGHSVVITADKHGKIIQFDPTTTVDIDLGYNPEVLSAKDIAQLDTKFCQAKSVTKKQAVLQDFSRLIDEKRAQALSSPKIRKELANIRNGFLAGLTSLSITTNPLNNNSHIFRSQGASWNALPESTGFAEISQVALELMQGSSTMFDLNTTFLAFADHLEHYNTRTQREQIQWLSTVMKKHKIQLSTYMNPISEARLKGSFSLADYYSSKDSRKELWTMGSRNAKFTSENIASILSSLDKKLDSYNLMGIIYSNLQEVDISSYDIPKHCRRFLMQEHARNHLLSWLSTDAGIVYCLNHIDPKFNLKINEVAYFAIHFIVKIQQALLSPEKHKSFLKEFKCEESLIVAFVNQYLSLNPQKTKYLTKEKITIKPKMKNEAFYVHPDDIQRLQRNFIKAIKKIDIRQATGVTKEEKQTRPYSPGDDVKKINWKVWARTDRLYVDSSPETIQGISSPIYIIFGAREGISSSGIEQQQFYEHYYILALQQEMQRSGREFFVGTLESDTYFKLHHNSNPKAFLRTLYKQNRGTGYPNPFRIRSKSGSINSGNFMLISSDFTQIACLQYLASKQPRTSLHYVYTNEPEFHIYPLLKDEWVIKGEEYFAEK